MSSWDDMLAGHVRGLSSPSLGAEPVTWHFGDDEERTFNAHVFRLGAQSTGGGRAKKRRARVELPVHAELGIDVELWNPDTDKIELVLEQGGAAVTCSIDKVLEHDGGAIRVEVEG